MRFLLLLMLSSVAWADNNDIVIGLDADMSSVAKEGGVAIERGALIAIDEINQAGGVLGKPLRLVVKDHRGNPARGMANINYFAGQPNVAAVLGGVHTPVALQELPLIHQHQLVYLDPWAAGTPIVDNGYSPNYVFRVSVRDQEAGKVLLKHALNNEAKKIGLLLEKTGWGRSNDVSMTVAAKELGLEIVDRAWFHWGAQSLQLEINALLEAGAETIVLVANAPEGAEAAKAMLALDTSKRVPVISHWGLASGAFVEKVGVNNLKSLNLSVLQTYHFTAPSNVELRDQLLKQYQQKFDSTITAKSMPGAVGTAHAYDLVHMLALAIEQAGSIEGPVMQKALEQIDQYEGLVKNYKPPFTAQRHDALWADDYLMTEYDENGHLQPFAQ